jgi:hypothetical protein
LVVLSLFDSILLLWGKDSSVLGEVQYPLLKRGNNVENVSFKERSTKKNQQDRDKN